MATATCTCIVVDSYFRLGLSDSLINTNLSDEEKAIARASGERLAKRMFEINSDEIEYYLSLEPDFAEQIQQDVEMYKYGINDQIIRLMEVYMPDSELLDDMIDEHLKMEERLQNKRDEIANPRRSSYSF